MKISAVLFLALISFGASAASLKCERHYGKSTTSVFVLNDKYVVIYEWRGSFPTEEHFEGKLTSKEDGIFTFHDFISAGNTATLTTDGVVGEFGGEEFDCATFPISLE